MTEEKADQIIRCVKECWWRIAVLLSIPTALTFWVLSNEQNSDWKLGWTALASVGTVLAAVAAFSASNVALKIAQEERLKEAEERRQQALIYKWVFMDELARAQVAFEAIEKSMVRYLLARDGQELTEEAREYMDDIVEGISVPLLTQRISDLHLFGVQTGRGIAGILANIPQLQNSITTITREPAVITEVNKRIAELVLYRLQMVWKYYELIEWPKDTTETAKSSSTELNPNQG